LYQTKKYFGALTNRLRGCMMIHVELIGEGFKDRG
jgi:hypothetical protein